MKKSDRKAIKRFDTLAAKYCKIIKGHKAIGRGKLISEIGRILPSLYAAAWELPATKKISDKSVLRGRTNDEFFELFHVLQEKLGSWDVYWFVFDPIQEKEAITQCLADDLADVYYDLRSYLSAVADGARLEDAVWELRLAYESHWGRHLTSALRVIHDLRYSDA